LTGIFTLVKDRHTFRRTSMDMLQPASSQSVQEVVTVARPELGTKRVCPETGRKFYDLNKDPIVSPYTGKTYPMSFFDDDGADPVKEDVMTKPADETEADEADVEVVESDDSTVSLEDADEDSGSESDSSLPDLGDNTDDEVLDDEEEDDDTFLASEDDDDDDDMSGLIDVAGKDDED
jgi:uncharacterized protein (TIGR02300 family)